MVYGAEVAVFLRWIQNI